MADLTAVPRESPVDRTFEILYRIEHRHHDGSWGEMVEDRAHHSPSDHDPERSWSLRRIFRCTSCEEAVTVIPGEEGGVPTER
jgi:hypothetical protein